MLWKVSLTSAEWNWKENNFLAPLSCAIQLSVSDPARHQAPSCEVLQSHGNHGRELRVLAARQDGTPREQSHVWARAEPTTTKQWDLRDPGLWDCRENAPWLGNISYSKIQLSLSLLISLPSWQYSSSLVTQGSSPSSPSLKWHWKNEFSCFSLALLSENAAEKCAQIISYNSQTHFMICSSSPANRKNNTTTQPPPQSLTGLCYYLIFDYFDIWY